MSLLKYFLRDRRGSTAIEYGLICALIFLVAVGSMQVFGTKVSAMFTNISGKMP